MENKNKNKNEYKKFTPKETRARCKVCGKTFYSITTNRYGEIICPDCDYNFDTNYTLELKKK